MTPSTQVEAFLARYSPQVAAQLQEARARLRKSFPRGYELVYDNYNALVFAFSPSERASDAVVSVAGYPKWVTLFFLHGATLPDPSGVLQGSGSQVRSVRLAPLERLLEPAVQALISSAIQTAVPEFSAAPSLATVIKSVSAVQRPRVPPESPTAKPRSRARAQGGA